MKNTSELHKADLNKCYEMNKYSNSMCYYEVGDSILFLIKTRIEDYGIKTAPSDNFLVQTGEFGHISLDYAINLILHIYSVSKRFNWNSFSIGASVGSIIMYIVIMWIV